MLSVRQTEPSQTMLVLVVICTIRPGAGLSWRSCRGGVECAWCRSEEKLEFIDHHCAFGMRRTAVDGQTHSPMPRGTYRRGSLLRRSVWSPKLCIVLSANRAGRSRCAFKGWMPPTLVPERFAMLSRSIAAICVRPVCRAGQVIQPSAADGGSLSCSNQVCNSRRKQRRAANRRHPCTQRRSAPG